MTSHDEHRDRKRDLSRLIKLITFALTVTAVVKELRTPPDERHWNGVVVGFVPYDLRFPTIERVKERMWNPTSTRLIGPRVFGVGWTLNVGRLVALVRAKLAG